MGIPSWGMSPESASGSHAPRSRRFGRRAARVPGPVIAIFGRRFLRRLNPPRIGDSHSGYVALVEDTWYLLRNFSPFTPIFCGFLWVKVMSRPRENRAIFLKASDPGELRGFIA